MEQLTEKDILAVRKILELHGHLGLSELLKGSKSKLQMSGQYGSVHNSILTAFQVYSPIEKYYEFKKIKKSDFGSIVTAIHDLYPTTEGEPEIDSVKFLLLREEVADEIKSSTSIGRTVRAFISYSTEDKILAGKIKEGLESFGIETFLAHEDIDPAAEWEQVIIDNLESTDIFIPVITKNFPKSKWTDQESGIAFTKSKVIVPVSIDGNHPYGFIGKFQSLKLDTKSKDIDCISIIQAVIKKKSQLETQIIDSVIKIFVSSFSWDAAARNIQPLLKFDNFSKDQIRKICLAVIDNSQINGSFGARSNIRTFLNNHEDLVDKDTLELCLDLLRK